MLLRSGIDTLDCIMPENSVTFAMTTDEITYDKKQVLIDGPLRGKRIVGLRTYYESMEKERRGTLLSLFKNGRSEAVRQIVDVLLELTLVKEEDPPPTK